MPPSFYILDLWQKDLQKIEAQLHGKEWTDIINEALPQAQLNITHTQTKEHV